VTNERSVARGRSTPIASTASAIQMSTLARLVGNPVADADTTNAANQARIANVRGRRRRAVMGSVGRRASR